MKEINATKCEVKECNEDACFMHDTAFPDEPTYTAYGKYTISMPLCTLHAILIQKGTDNTLRRIVSQE